MREQQETWFIANDGTRFNDRQKCADHEALCAAINSAMSGLPPAARMEMGQYQRVDPRAAKRAMLEILRLCLPFYSGPNLQRAIDNISSGGDAHIALSWAGRIIDDCCPMVLYRAFSRLYCIDNQGREWQQPYYVDHPEESRGEYIA